MKSNNLIIPLCSAVPSVIISISLVNELTSLEAGSPPYYIVVAGLSIVILSQILYLVDLVVANVMDMIKGGR